MYMVEPAREFGVPERARWALAAAWVAGIGVLALGLYPLPVLDWAQASIGFIS